MEQKVLPNSDDFMKPLRSLYQLKETSYHNVTLTYLSGLIKIGKSYSELSIANFACLRIWRVFSRFLDLFRKNLPISCKI